MTVAAVSMFHNEADVAPWVVRHMLGECDLVIVADNNSTDGSRQLLEAIGDPRLVIVDEPSFAYHQAATMNRLAQMAADRGAWWVVPFDFDEWWYVTGGGRIADALRALPDDVFQTATHAQDMIPQPTDPPYPNPFARPVWTRPGSLWNQSFNTKVAYRPLAGRVLVQGNHGLEGRTWPGVGPLRIRHLPFRSIQQAAGKLRHGRDAVLAADLPWSSGSHWQEWGALDDAGLARWWADWTRPAGLVPLGDHPRAIIMANGARERWRNHLGVPKHHIEIGGERLLDRMIRQLRANGILDIIVSGPYPDHDVVSVIPVQDPDLVDGRLSVSGFWNDAGRTIILLGDVYYTDDAMRTIAGHEDRDQHLFARFGPSSVAGKDWPEIFANSFWPEHRAGHAESLRTIADMRIRREIPQAGLWEVYLGEHGHPIRGKVRCRATDRAYISEDRRIPNLGNATEIDDWTDDFDHPADYDAFIARRGAA